MHSRGGVWRLASQRRWEIGSARRGVLPLDDIQMERKDTLDLIETVSAQRCVGFFGGGGLE
jgi:hypothetical protein